MSMYIPWSAVERELQQQLKRRLHGLKTGFYVRFPDADKGPLVFKKSIMDAMSDEDKAKLVAVVDKYKTKEAP